MNKSSYILMLAAWLLASQPLIAQQQYNNGQYGRSTQMGGNYYGNGQYIGRPYAGPGQYNSGYGQYYGNFGQYPYVGQPGYYGANPYAGSLPALGAPVPINGGLYRFNVGGFSGAYWKSPSGYYYPWGAGTVYSAPPPVILVNQGASQPTQPPISEMLKDMNTYVEEQNSKKKFKPDDYQHLARRVRDLQSLESSMRSRDGGTLEPSDEESLRKDCAMLSGDISRRVIP